jgi:hypothetical protein
LVSLLDVETLKEAQALKVAACSVLNEGRSSEGRRSSAHNEGRRSSAHNEGRRSSAHTLGEAAYRSIIETHGAR